MDSVTLPQKNTWTQLRFILQGHNQSNTEVSGSELLSPKHALDVCVPSTFHMLKPTPHCDGIWRWKPLGGD